MALQKWLSIRDFDVGPPQPAGRLRSHQSGQQPGEVVNRFRARCRASRIGHRLGRPGRVEQVKHIRGRHLGPNDDSQSRGMHHTDVPGGRHPIAATNECRYDFDRSAARAEHDMQFLYAGIDPAFEWLAGDAEFKHILNAVGVPGWRGRPLTAPG